MHGLDIETAKPDGGGALDPAEGRIRLVQISDGETADVYDVDHRPRVEVQAAISEHDDLVAHNANFERRWISEHLGLDLDLDDTMVMSQVVYTGTRASQKRLSHALASVVKRELKVDMAKDEQLSDWDADFLTRAQVIYAAEDAAVLPPLAEKLMRRIGRAELEEVYRLEQRVARAVEAMERHGVAMHRDELEKMIGEATEEAARLKAQLAEEWGINPGSSKQLIERFGLRERRGWPKTDGGNPKTDQEAMAVLAEEDASVEKWATWKAVEKIRSTYGQSILEKLTPAGRIHGRFHAFGTATGRFSSSDPNLQNIPKRGERGKRMRAMFWSGADDRILVKADYASIELWVAAVLWEDPAMQAALREGINMHVRTAAALFNVKPEKVTDEQKATGKIVNFALLYGGSANRLLREFLKNKMSIDKRGAERLHEKFFRTYKGFSRRREELRQAYGDHEHQGRAFPAVHTAIGRRRTFAGWYGPLLNHEIQGTAADGLKYALARLHEQQANFPEVRLVLTVHDEIVVEAPAAQKEEVSEWIEHHMVEGMLEGVRKGRNEVPSLPIVEIESGREWS